MNRISWVIIGVSVLIIIVISIFFLYPNIKGVWQIMSETNKANKDLTEVSQKKDVLAQLSKNNQLASLYDIASKYIPETQNSSELVIELSAMANQANMKVEQVSLDTPTAPKTDAADTEDTTTKSTTTVDTTKGTDKSNLGDVKFTIKISGTFPDYLTFLQNVETSSRLITLNAMNLTQSTTGFTAQITGTAYHKKGVTLENSLANIQIPQTTINKFQNLKTYGVPINLPTESGFGRTNPFDSIP